LKRSLINGKPGLREPGFETSAQRPAGRWVKSKTKTGP
jgi:hypothetical protein